jgi:hypothetical protein
VEVVLDLLFDALQNQLRPTDIRDAVVRLAKANNPGAQ